MTNVVTIPIQSFEEEHIYDAFCEQLAKSHAAFVQTGEAAYSRLYNDLFKALRNLERFWEGD